MKGLTAYQARNFCFFFQECVDFSSKATLVRFATSVLTARLKGALRTGTWHARFPDKEFFLRLRMADLWFQGAAAELQVYQEVFCEPDYELHGAGPQPGDAILDVGANIGLFTLRYARRFRDSRVYAFEPNPPVYRRLVRNLEANCLRNVVAINAPVAGSSGRRPFFVGPITTIGSIIDDGKQAVLPAFHTEAIDLDSFCKARAVKSVGLLKIDVEGAEMEVLSGAQEVLQVTRTLMVECHSDKLATSVHAFLVARGFKPSFRTIPWGDGPFSVVHFDRLEARQKEEGRIGPTSETANITT